MVAYDAIALYYRVISVRLCTIILPRDAVLLDTSSPVLFREENTSKFHKTAIYLLEITFQSAMIVGVTSMKGYKELKELDVLILVYIVTATAPRGFNSLHVSAQSQTVNKCNSNVQMLLSNV